MLPNISKQSNDSLMINIQFRGGVTLIFLTIEIGQ